MRPPNLESFTTLPPSEKFAVQYTSAQFFSGLVDGTQYWKCRCRRYCHSGGGWAAPQVAEALDAALSTVYRVKQRFAEEGLEGVLQDRPQANRPRKLDDRGEAHLIALACSPPPAGHDHWTLRLLAGKVVELGLTPSMSHEGVRQRLKKTPSSRGRRRSGAFPR